VLRIVFNEACRQKSLDHNFAETLDPAFSSVVDFVNQDQCVRANAVSCHFLSSRYNLSQGSRTKSSGAVAKAIVKVFRFSEKHDSIVLANPGATTHLSSDASKATIGIL